MACSTPTAWTKLATPGDEVLSFILRKEAQGEQVTVKTIVDTFQAKPYGWDLASIEVFVACLIGASKVTLTVDGNVLKRSEVAAALRNTQKHSHAVVAPQKTFDERKVAAFRKFCTDFFDEANAPKDPLELARHGADKLKGKLDELKATVTGSKYPFVEQLDGPIGLLEQAVGKSDDWYLTDFNLGDDLLDAKESVIDPIQSFLNGAQRIDLRRGRRHCWPRTAATSATCRPAATRRQERARRPERLPGQQDGAAQAGRRRARAARSTRSSPRTARRSSPRSRAARLSSLASAFYAKATPEAQQSVVQRDRPDARASRRREPDRPHPADRIELRGERSTRRCSTSSPPRQQGRIGDDPPPPKQTVSVKTDRGARRIRRSRNRRGRRQVPRRPAQLRSSRP